MFFADKIKSIKPEDKVLEIGPGATPHPRSDIFLEKTFDTNEELIAQSGNVGILSTNKKIVYYSGDIFPFNDKEFDYVICSHVLEHVDNVDIFIKEVQRIGKKGYLEFPTLYYDYIYNFSVHKQFVFFSNNRIYWMPKSEMPLDVFSPVQAFFYKSCVQNYYRLINDFKGYFFQGFEWVDKIETERVNDLSKLTYLESEVDFSYLNKSNINADKTIKIKFKNLLIKIINKI